MVLLTCDFDINPALMSSLANEFIAARVCSSSSGLARRRQRRGGGAPPRTQPLSQSRTSCHSCSYVIGSELDAVTAATDAVAGVTAAGS